MDSMSKNTISEHYLIWGVQWYSISEFHNKDCCTHYFNSIHSQHVKVVFSASENKVIRADHAYCKASYAGFKSTSSTLYAKANGYKFDIIC